MKSRMESLLQFLSLHADYAHILIFGLLMLTGLSLPISEELIILMGGILASSVIPDRTFHLLIAAFLGCYLSDWVAYWLGRFLGTRLINSRWLCFVFNAKKQEKLRHYYRKYGFWTLLVGRFIPFGVRTGVFLSAGIARMHFGKFALCDCLGCILFSLLLFVPAYYCGKNCEIISSIVYRSNIIIFILFTLGGAAALLWVRKKTKPQTELPN